jgi:hypothetical protein
MGLEQRCCTARCSLDGRSIDTGFYRADILCSETVSQPPILIKVGPEGRQFHVFKSLLIRYSDYFQAALRSSGTFKEAEDGIITLPDVDVETFEAFTAFLYSKLLSEKDYRYPGGILKTGSATHITTMSAQRIACASFDCMSSRTDSLSQNSRPRQGRWLESVSDVYTSKVHLAQVLERLSTRSRICRPVISF